MDARALTLLVWLLPWLAWSSGFELQPGLEVLEPLTHGTLAVYPVVAVAPGTGDGTRYLTLKQGLQEKLVSVRELGQGAEVNRVQVKNTSDRPLLLLAGELILGGQQDRVLSTDTLLEPRSSRAVEVFCVEHGRWSGQGQFGGLGGLAEGKLRRLARRDRSQAEVWAHVAKKTAALKADSATGTYRTLAVGQGGDAVMKPFRADIGEKLKAHGDAKRMVGLLTAVSGNILSLEVFASPELFQEYRERLLDSAYLDAAGLELAPAPQPPSASTVKAWVSENERAAQRSVEATPISGTTAKESEDAYGTELKSRRGEVYKSIQSKKY
jgi:hypothetical protein